MTTGSVTNGTKEHSGAEVVMKSTITLGLAAAITAVAVCGCSVGATVGTPSNESVPHFGHPFQARLNNHIGQRGWVSPIVNTGVPLIYVGDNNCRCIHEYVQGTGALVGLITQGVGTPGGLATDSSGNLWVATYTGVAVYAPGATSPFKTLTDTQNSADLAVADDGTVYVSNWGPTPSVFVYANGSTNPTSMLFDAEAAQGEAVAIDKNRNLYWGAAAGNNQPPFVDEFVKGKGMPIRTLVSNLLPQWMTFGPNNRLVISDYNVPTIDVFALPGNLVRQFGQTGTPFGIGLNPYGRIFVADHFNHQIEVYDYTTGALLKTFPTSAFYPTGLALFPRFHF
jgi:hypothetical protein